MRLPTRHARHIACRVQLLANTGAHISVAAAFKLLGKLASLNRATCLLVLASGKSGQDTKIDLEPKVQSRVRTAVRLLYTFPRRREHRAVYTSTAAARNGPAAELDVPKARAAVSLDTLALNEWPQILKRTVMSEGFNNRSLVYAARPARHQVQFPKLAPVACYANFELTVVK